MDHVFLFACGLLWSKCGDVRAGWELIGGLQSFDPTLRQLSLDMLARRPAHSMQLLSEALDFGVLLPEDGWQALHVMAHRRQPENDSRTATNYRRQFHELALRATSHR